MELIIRERQSGKTTELINLSFSTKNVIVCRNQRHKQAILNMAERMHKEIPEPVTYQELITQVGKHYCGILIDDCEHFLEFITKHKVNAVSFSAITKTRG